MSDPFPHQSSSEAINILLVEDNPGDVRLIREAFKEAEKETEFHTITNGGEAIDFLTSQATDDSITPPDLVLLDLNLPGSDGCEVLESIRDTQQIQPLPVIMLTSSGANEDVIRCYDASANAYLTKPTNPDEFVALVKTVEQFWFEKARLPPIPIDSIGD